MFKRDRIQQKYTYINFTSKILLCRTFSGMNYKGLYKNKSQKIILTNKTDVTTL